MENDFVELLIHRAHSLLGGYSVYEVIDLDDARARGRVQELYGNIDSQTEDAYLKAVSEIRLVTTASQKINGPRAQK